MARTKGTVHVDVAFQKAFHETIQRALRDCAMVADAFDILVERFAALEELAWNAYITSTACQHAGSGSASETDLGPEDRDVGHDGQQPVV